MMEYAFAFLAGLIGGFVAVGIVAFVSLRKIKANPQFQMMQSMNSMMGSVPPGSLEDQIMGMGDPRGFRKYS